MNLLKFYYKLPISFQNALMSLYGYKLKFFRYNKAFDALVSDLRERNQFSVTEMIELQNSKLQEMINHAYENVPYYRNQMDRHNIKPHMIKTAEDLVKLPIISKEDVKSNINEFYAENYSKTKEHHTGGTTGSPLVIKTTNEEERYNFALYEVREKELFGVGTGQKTATFLGKKIVNPNTKEPPFWRQASSLNQTMYSVYHMRSDTLKYYIDNLREDTPIYITGYVNPIYQLAEYIIKNKLEPLRIKAVFLSSETLHSWQKSAIEKAFSCEVCNGYSQAEGVSFISTCREGKLHVHPDYGVTEFIPVEGTDYYEIVGTTLFNFAMPLIRYRTRDYVLLDENQKCDCGLPFYPIVKEIIGRDDSSIKSVNGKVISSAALSLIFRHFPNIQETQIIQERIDSLEILLVYRGIFSASEEKEFLNMIQSIFGDEFSISISLVDEIPKTTSGKHKLIVSKL